MTAHSRTFNWKMSYKKRKSKLGLRQVARHIPPTKMSQLPAQQNKSPQADTFSTLHNTQVHHTLHINNSESGLDSLPPEPL